MYYPYDKVNPFWLKVLKYWFFFADNDEIVSKNELDRKRPTTISPTKIKTLLSPTKISPDFYNSLYKNANWMNDAKGNKVTHFLILLTRYIIIQSNSVITNTPGLSIFVRPCVPGIVAFIAKNIEPLIFFSSYSLCSNHLNWEFTKNQGPSPFAGMHLWFPACFRDSRPQTLTLGLCSRRAFLYFIRVTIPGTLWI